MQKNLERFSQHPQLIKEQYLPPPLQKNHLSLFDIQVKMAKNFQQGSEQEKMAIIKKRIKKFFDYGNQSSDTNQTHKKKSKQQTEQYKPFQIDMVSIKDKLQIDCTQIILYGKQAASFQAAEKMFPGFICFQKIDDCNIKLSFSNIKQCQELILKKIKTKSSIMRQRIKNPFEIEWFELQFCPEQQNQDSFRFFARYLTNKDDILLNNDHYFRKLLGKARELTDKKEQEVQKRQKEIEEKYELRKYKFQNKRKFISKKFCDKNNRRDFDTQTNYDGIHSERPKNNFYHSDQRHFYNSQEAPFFFSTNQQRNKGRRFNDLNISQIKQLPIQLEERKKRKYSRDWKLSTFSSRDSIDLGKSSDKNEKLELSESNPTNKLIKAHREKSGCLKSIENKFIKSYDYEKELNQKVKREIVRSKRPVYELNDSC